MVEDTLLFGAKEMSSPGFLLPKNITEIENNIMDSNSTQVHQNAYVKMIIAGCYNQAKRIFAKFDKVIQGRPAEYFIEKTHEKIRALLRLADMGQFLDQVDCENEAALTSSDDFI